MENSERQKYLRNLHFLTKETWPLYVEDDLSNKSFEHFGYLSATQGIVIKLKEILKANDETEFRSKITELMENREDLLDFACEFMEKFETKTSRSKKTLNQ